MKVTIDFGRWLHALRRAWWARFGRREPSRCCDCGACLTADERHYYENQCERCVGHDMERLGC